MMLHAQHMPGQPGAPSLVFLHGFSGDCREWQPVGEQFHGCSRLYIDLPGHGGSAAIPVGGFADVIRLLRATLISYNILKFWLVGYSLGGRVAMMAACQGIPGLCGLVVEGGHPGLQNEQARAERRLSDGRWAERFRREPLTEVFHDWYQQPVFASLTAQQRQALTALRSQNNGENAGCDAGGDIACRPAGFTRGAQRAGISVLLFMWRTRQQIPRPGAGSGGDMPCHS
ncbi:acyl-CoA thioester hydrolase YfbB [Salmonella enterica subsp. enterica]|uniref:Acyl-CoA thioester hydrolase YfbB n=1 Tax=Salmonella enterica I TaxID=59201 RepID=A0A379USX6_SALET|nr:acyl-CoA thioester hydrolase YfbB [Salmonella enterica subsp. enterica]